MKLTPVLLALALAVTPIHAEPPAGYTLKWADEFDGTQLDTAKWIHWLPGKRRQAMNVPEAVTVRDGLLTIATYTEGGKHFTGMISTKDKYEASYGYYEARIQWADAPGQWAAFWSQSPTMGKPVGDVATAGMEIDFVEHREVDHEGKRIAGKANFTLHWDGYGKDHKGKGHMTPELGLDKGFHIYGFEWTESAYRFYIDGKLRWEVKEPISKRPQFIILSSEVESGAWSHTIPAGGYGDRTTSKTKLVVDYVRHYVKP
jgi:beta-glucanase (GH16 family)